MRIARALRKQRGNILLIGLAGCGRETLARLSALMLKQQVMRRGGDSFRADLQSLVRTAGEGNPTCYIAKDVKEKQLEDLSNLVNSGEVPGLFGKKEEVEEMVQGARKEAQAAKVQDSPEALYAFWLGRMRDCLHMVFCISPVGEFLRSSCRKFPALVSGCNLVWCWEWPASALQEIALKQLAPCLSADNLPRFVRLAVAIPAAVNKLCQEYRAQTGRLVYTTPQSYLDHLALFQHLLRIKGD